MNETRVDLGPRRPTLTVCKWNEHASGPPLLVLHGYLEQGAAWDEVARRLDRPVWAPDHRGHGRSDHVGTGGFYHFWDYVADVDALLEAWSPDSPVDLLGHSMGGTMACLYAGTRPERIRRLVLVEGLGPPDTEAAVVDRARQFLHHLREPRHHGAPMNGLAGAASRMRRHNRSLTEASSTRLAERMTTDTAGGTTWTWDSLHRARSPTPFSMRQFQHFLQAITASTLVVYGAESRFPGVDRAEFLSDAAVLHLADAGHLIHHDQPAPLAAAIEAHLG